MSTATAPAPWWRTAPNPPCISWCTFDHPDEDFADTHGGMLCTRMVATTPKFTVEVQRHVGTTDSEDDYEYADPEVWLTVTDNRMSTIESAAFAAALTEANSFLAAREEQR